MAVNDIYQVRDIQEYAAQRVENVFYYRVTGGGSSSAEDLNDAFQAGVLDAVTNIQVADLTHTQVRVVNGMSNGDQFIDDISIAGNRAIGGAPPFLAIGFRKRSIGVGSRYSYKRFGGLPISAINISAWNDVAGTFFDDVNALRDALGADLSGVATYQPVQITGGFVLGVSPTFKQALGPTWQISKSATHQDTRQGHEWVVTL